MKKDQQKTLLELLTIRKRAYADNIAKRFLAATGEELTWESVGNDNLRLFTRSLVSSGLSPNSADKYCGFLRNVLRTGRTMHPDCVEDGYEKVLSVQRSRSHEVYLDKREVALLIRHVARLTDPADIAILKLFVTSCYTGARISDLKNFDAYSITPTERGWFLTFTSEKTSERQSIPVLNPKIVAWFRKGFPALPMREDRARPRLRELCHDAGITAFFHGKHAGQDFSQPKYQRVGFHTARRSFATNMYLAGWTKHSIAKMMGHRNEAQTEGYICVDVADEFQNITDSQKAALL